VPNKEESYDAAGISGILSASVREARGQTAWAAKHGVSVSYLNDVMNGRRAPGAKILNALGVQKVVRYVTRRNAAGPETGDEEAAKARREANRAAARMLAQEIRAKRPGAKGSDGAG